MINLPKLAARLQAAGLINKSFLECTREEIEKLIEAIFSCPDLDEVPVTGWAKPIIYETEDGRRGLSIPFAAHPKYRWWTPAGQDVEATLIELGAPYEVARLHYRELTAEDWANKLKP